MKIIAFTLLSCSNLLFAQAASQVAKNEFPIVIEGVNCVVKAYQPATPLVFDPMVNKEALPKSHLIKLILLTKSDISSYMSDEELSKCVKSELINDDTRKEELEKFRASMKKMYGLTGPDAEDNPWKGMKHVLDRVFVVESEKGKFLIHQMSNQGLKDSNERSFGCLKSLDGQWLIGGEKDEETKKFKLSMMENIPGEFEKLQKESAVATLPLEDLLK